MSAVLQSVEPTLRPMREEDIPAVMGIEARVYPSYWTEGIFRDCLRVGYVCWVWDAGAGIAGYGVMSEGPGEAHILNIAMAPELQGRGLGRRMLDHLLHLARRHGAETAFLEVRPSNAVALTLYRSAGFRQVGRRKAYYPEGPEGREDALVFSLAL